MSDDVGLFSPRSGLTYSISASLEKADRIGATVLALADLDMDEELAAELVTELGETLAITDPRVAGAMQLLWRLAAALEEAIDEAAPSQQHPSGEESPA